MTAGGAKTYPPLEAVDADSNGEQPFWAVTQDALMYPILLEEPAWSLVFKAKMKSSISLHSGSSLSGAGSSTRGFCRLLHTPFL